MLPLENKRVLVTSGPTRGYIDAIRYISNTSTGLLGSKITIEALSLGAEVTLIYGAGSAVPKVGDIDGLIASRLNTVCIESNEDMENVIGIQLQDSHFDIVVHAMAVLDYVPEKTIEGKTPSDNPEWKIRLVRSPKVVKLIKHKWPEALFAGFKLEAGKTKEALIKRAMEFLSENNLDLVVANDFKEINGRYHKAYIINKFGEELGVYTNKDEIATGLIRSIIKMAANGAFIKG